MNATSPAGAYGVFSRIYSLLPISFVAIFAGVITACGSGGSMFPSGNASVTLLATSTANDQLQGFNIEFSSITLTNQSGAQVTLLATPRSVEFMHLNGSAEPLAVASIPQGTYTSATADISGVSFDVVQQISSANSDYFCEYGGGAKPASTAVNLPASITITGDHIVLLLNLLASKSETRSTCGEGPLNATITPTFDLTATTLTSASTNNQNGSLRGLQGMISSIDFTGNDFELALADSGTCVSATGQVCATSSTQGSANGSNWPVSVNGNTMFQGVADFAALAAGMPINMDASIQSDGSLLATRIDVQNTDVNNLSAFSGPIVLSAASQAMAITFGRQQQGWLFGLGPAGGPNGFSFGNAKFQITSQFSNLQNLPFSASFSGSNMFAGQNVSYTSNAISPPRGPNYNPAATVTLIPQTIDGTVTAIGTDGGFTTYTVSLASYDLFPNLAVQPGQTMVLNNPGTVIVYVGNNTQILSTGSLSIGIVARFNGLMFNDQGTLKMDCDWIGEGVPE